KPGAVRIGCSTPERKRFAFSRRRVGDIRRRITWNYKRKKAASSHYLKPVTRSWLLNVIHEYRDRNLEENEPPLPPTFLCGKAVACPSHHYPAAAACTRHR